MTTRQPIQTALARTGGKPIAIAVDLGEQFGGVIDYEFLPNVGADLIEKMSGLGAVRDGVQGPDRVPAQFDAMMDLLTTAATEQTAEALRGDVARRALDMGTVMVLGNAVIEELTGANPTKRNSSPQDSPEPGVSSTAGAVPAGLTPPPSPLTAS